MVWDFLEVKVVAVGSLGIPYCIMPKTSIFKVVKSRSWHKGSLSKVVHCSVDPRDRSPTNLMAVFPLKDKRTVL